LSRAGEEEAMKKFLTILLVAGLLAVAAAPGLAAPNPAGTGQPGAECGDEGATTEPEGFLMGGFAHAETVYAGSEGTPSLANVVPTLSRSTTSPAIR
jgi:hypothetical protein